jgi:hypothetical protein
MNEVNRTLAVGWHHRIGESSDIHIKPFLWKTRAPNVPPQHPHVVNEALRKAHVISPLSPSH